MNHTCSNCGSHVSAEYVRVFAEDGETVDCCPRCPDRLREQGRARDVRDHRWHARAVDHVY